MALVARVRLTEEYVVGSTVESLDLRGFNGSITWVASGGPGGRIVVEKEARGLSEGVLREFLQGMEVEKREEGQTLQLRGVYPHVPLGVFAVQIRFTIYAPPEQIRELRAETSNGRIRIEAPFQGRLSLTTKNGRIQLDQGEGEVELRTANGRIEFGKLVLQGSGSILTSNGRIEGQLELKGEGDYRIGTSNGSISLRLPQDSPGSFLVRTNNGRVNFQLGEEQASGRKEVALRRGEGPNVQITTSNGSISVVGY